MSAFTIVIPARGNPLGLWATIHSCEEDLSKAGFDYNYVIVTNGERNPPETRVTIEELRRSGRLLKHVHSEEPLTPPAARRLGVEESDGKLLFFFDNHCLVSRDYFKRAVLDFEHYNMDVLHSATVFQKGSGTTYHYHLSLEYNFWGRTYGIPQDELRPYLAACSGHGGFAVRREVWDALDGYGPDSVLSGYGGEETIFDLKAWRYGFKVHIDPKLVHYHYPGARGYSRHFTDDYYRNLLTSALVIGGEKWMYKVFHSFATDTTHMRANFKGEWYDVLTDAYTRGAEYARHVDANSKMSLDELLLWFRTNQVAM
jgi:hypothetical protein